MVEHQEAGGCLGASKTSAGGLSQGPSLEGEAGQGREGRGARGECWKRFSGGQEAAERVEGLGVRRC